MTTTVTISARLEALLDETLFALTDIDNTKRLKGALDQVALVAGQHRRYCQAKHVDETSYLLGASEMLQTFLVRSIKRRDGNQALAFVRRRKHVKDMLHFIAAARAPVAPSDVASRLGIQQTAVATLLKTAESYGLVRTVQDVSDARSKPRALTETGRALLTQVIPDWPLKHPLSREAKSDNVVRIRPLPTAKEHLNLFVVTATHHARNQRPVHAKAWAGDMGEHFQPWVQVTPKYGFNLKKDAMTRKDLVHEL